MGYIVSSAVPRVPAVHRYDDGSSMITLLSSLTALHRDYPHVSQWFRGLMGVASLNTATWTASSDTGYEAYYNYTVGVATRRNKVLCQ